MRDPGIVAVDLTPLLPGGENGGAKVVVLELMRRLAVRAPRTQFCLLTRAESHEELSVLDAANVQRRLVAGGGVREGMPGFTRGVSRWLGKRLPRRVRNGASRLAYRLMRRRRRAGAKAVLREIGAELLFCPFTAPTYAVAGVPVVSVVHDLQYLSYPQFFEADDVAHREQVFRAACREATLIVAISDYARESAIRHGCLEPHRIRTIHHRLGDRFGAAARPDELAVSRFGLSRGRYLIYPANFWKHKNHEMLLTAFGVAARRGLSGDIRLVCTGAPGPRRDFLMRAAEAMGLGSRVVFPGYVSTEELGVLLGGSAGMVFPSLYEGFGMPVIEAMAVGVPVACSDATSLPEIATGAAALFDPRIPEQIATAMIRLVSDPVQRAELVAAGLQRAAEYSDAGRMAAEYLDVFRQAMALPRAQRGSRRA
jgi:glycosyltransferase involved in cell wall biosynthesis